MNDEHGGRLIGRLVTEQQPSNPREPGGALAVKCLWDGDAGASFIIGLFLSQAPEDTEESLEWPAVKLAW